LALAASACIAAAVLPAVGPVGVSTPPLLAFFWDNEIPNSIMDNIFEIGGDVLAFLLRMSPF
jgi:hypothetical protein